MMFFTATRFSTLSSVSFCISSFLPLIVLSLISIISLDCSSSFSSSFIFLFWSSNSFYWSLNYFYKSLQSVQAPSFLRIFTELFFFCLISDLFEIEERITFKAFWVSVCANWSNLVFSSISSSKRLWFRISSWSRLKSWSSLSGSKLAMSVSLYSTSSGKSLIDCILPLDCLSFMDYLISPIFVMLPLILL